MEPFFISLDNIGHIKTILIRPNLDHQFDSIIFNEADNEESFVSLPSDNR